MKKNLLYLLALMFIGFAGVSCSDDDDPIIPPVIDETSCLIINQGNWSERNASISYYNETDSVVSNVAFIAANGRRLAALAESGASNGTIGLIICNNPDKIEVIDINTAKTVANPITGDKLINPRYAVMTKDYAYVTCWGKDIEVDGWWDEEHLYERWTYPNAYIARIDLKTYTVKDTVACGNDAEGIILLNNKLFVAVSNGLEVYNTSDMSKAGEVKHTSNLAAKHLNTDKNGRIWYSVSDGLNKGGFVSVNVANVGNAAHMEIDKEVPYTNAQGYFVMNKDKSKLLFFTNESQEWVVTKSNIYALSVDNQTVNSQPIYQGNYINGIGVSPHSGKIYTAEIFGYTENSLLKIMDEDGKNMIVKEAGVAASRFVFFTPEN